MLKFFTGNTKLRNSVLCALSGVLLALSFPPFKSWYLIYFGLLIFLYLILSAGRFRQAFGRAYFALIVFNEITLYWISGWHSNDTFLKIGGVATVLVHPLFLIIPAALTYHVSKSLNKYAALALFPFMWVCFEYCHNLWQFAFPWLELGNSESYNINRIQYVELTGVHGVSFLICTVVVILYVVCERIYTRKWEIFKWKTAVTLVVIMVMLLAPNYYSVRRLSYSKNETYFKTNNPEKIINTCITQANTDPYKKWGGNQDSLIDEYFEILTHGLDYKPDLILLHETAPPYYFFDDYNRDKTKRFINYVNTNHLYLLMGIPHRLYYDNPESAPNDARVSASGRKWDAFNSVILLEPGKTEKDYFIHMKVKLVPFSERVPYQEIFPFAEKLVNWGVGISHWQKGKELNLFELNNSELKPKAKFEAIICFESVFSEFVSEGVKNGAEFIAIVTNDGWWGNTSGPYQHEQYAVLRAIENRKWIVRCAQTGVSCFIDPLGNIHNEIPYYTSGVKSRDIIANNEITFYASTGDFVGRVGCYISVIALIASIVNYVTKKRKTLNGN